MLRIASRCVWLTLLTSALLAVSVNRAGADGTEILGDPLIEIAEGTDVVAAGVGLAPGTPGAPTSGKITINVPGTVTQALLYWEGQMRTDVAGPNTITVDGNPVTGTLIGGPTFFFSGAYSSAYRADITGLVSEGTNTLTIGSPGYTKVSNGAGLLVVYDDDSGEAQIGVRDGVDLAFVNFSEPRKSTIAQTFTFEPTNSARVANLSMFFGSVAGAISGADAERPTSVDITVGGETIMLSNVLASLDGEEWDTLNFPIEIPAGATELTVQALSVDNLNTGNLPASFSWTAAALSVRPPLLAALGDRVWQDLNNNGIQDNGEPGVIDVTVKLFGPDCQDEIATTTTDSAGLYLFDNLEPGVYCVEFVRPEGFAFTEQNVGADDTVDSDADVGTGRTVNIPLAAGQIDLTWDAGLVFGDSAALGDRVWEDLNADGIQDCVDTNSNGIIGDAGDTGPECDTGIPNVTVTLVKNPDGDADCDSDDESDLAVTTSDADGFYEFTDLDPDVEYCVRFDQVSANKQLQCDPIIGSATFSPQNKGIDDAVDSDANTTTGQTENISLNAGDFDRTWDAGLYCPAKIGDSLINDLNRDGIQDLGEPGIDGQPVELIECKNGVPGDVIDTINETGPDGMYMFNPLPPGEYAVRFTAPPDFEFSPKDQGTDEALDCDTDVNGLTECVVLGPNEYNPDVDACVNQPPTAGLGDFVWEDENADGIQDMGESGISDVTVNLYNSADCSGALADSTQTDANGFYEFINLEPGNYCVEFEKPDICDPIIEGVSSFSPPNQGNDDARDSDADPATGQTSVISLAQGEFDPTNDAGVFCPAKLGDRVWLDDNDGIQDCEDTNNNGIIGDTGDTGSECDAGVGGVTVNLFGCGPDGEPGGGDDEFVSDTGTDTEGFYMFNPLEPGKYFVEFKKPAGIEDFTELNQGGDDAVDSDCRPSGETACVMLGSNDIDRTTDCGLIQPPPECDLVLDKTCRVETPPQPAFDKCKGKLQQFTVIWTGDPIAISGLPNDAPGGEVSTNQEVTFFGPFSKNDVVVDISGAVNGQSTFHMSCSDKDFNSPDDCDKFAGDGKGKSGFINAWKLEGFIDAEGKVLDCTTDSAAGFPTDDRCEFSAQPANCDVLGKPTSLTFRYIGSGCAASDNGQPDKHQCSGDVNGVLPVEIVAGKKNLKKQDDLYAVSPDMVVPGEEFTISASKFAGDSEIEISNSGGTEENIFHTSCSQPLAVGDVFGSLELIGFNGNDEGTSVTYGYTVTNNGDPVTGVQLIDDHLGDIAGGKFDLGTDETMQFTQMASIAKTTTNVATASVTLIDGKECSASDDLTVDKVKPLTPVSCKDIKDITQIQLIWNGAGPINIQSEHGESISGINTGDVISLQTPKKDTDVSISGAVSGTSTFHVSCSDKEMDGSDDCGEPQGNGKSNQGGLINDWLLDGMTGKKGQFHCP